MARRSLTGARTIVTGASSGIGRALVFELARHGARILITARRADRLETLATELQRLGCEVQVVVGDITSAEVRRELLEVAQAKLGGLDLLVNNAGVGALGLFADATEDRLRRIMEVNFFAPVELIRAALPILQRGNRPMIVNVGSVLGHRAVPKKSEYCASKFAMHGMSDALRAELAAKGIDLLLVSPSTTDSEFFDNVLEGKSSTTEGPLGRMPADIVARRTARAIQAGRHEIILSFGGKLLVWLDRLCPWLVDRVLAKVS